MMLVRYFPGREVTPEEDEQLRKEINETIHCLNEGEIEKGMEKAQQIFSLADKWRGPPLFMWDFIASMLYGEYLPDQGSNEKYLRFLRAVINKRILDHDWIRRCWELDTPNPISNVATWLISEVEYDLAQQLLRIFPSQFLTREQIDKILSEVKRNNKLIQELRKRVPDLNDLEKCLKDQKKFDKVFRTVMEDFKETSKESAVNNGKEEVRKRIQKYRHNPNRYINKLEQKYPKTYEILYSCEAIFSHFIFGMPIWKDVEATPKAVNYFKAIETFLEARIPPPNNDIWNLGDYIYNKKGIKSVLNKTWRYRWREPYNHKTLISKGKRYSLFDGLKQFLNWRNGKLHTGITKWDFVNSQLSPFTYELLCDLIDGVT